MSTKGIVEAKRDAIAASKTAFYALLDEITAKYPKRDPYTVAERLEKRGAVGTPFTAAFAHLRRCSQVEEVAVDQWLAAGGLSLH